MKLAITVPIIENIEFQPNYVRLVVKAPELAQIAKPGQFAMIRSQKGIEPFLNRPLGFNCINKKRGTITFVYQVIGKGTRFLMAKKPGDEILLNAPLGNGFPIFNNEKNIMILAGGIGSAPLLALAQELSLEDKKVTVILGAREKNMLVDTENFKACGCEVALATDDGSIGHHGLATDLLPEFLKNQKFDRVYCCGKNIVMEKVARMTAEANVPCFVSLEEVMGCGFGVCMGCTCDHKDEKGIKTKKRVCCEGPVFDAKEVFFYD